MHACRCLLALKQVSKAFGGLDGICTFCEMAVPLAARLAEQFGLPTNTPDAVDLARDKFQTRRAMENAGLPTPRNMLCESPQDVEAAAKHVGFPCVIKPIAGARQACAADTAEARICQLFAASSLSHSLH